MVEGQGSVRRPPHLRSFVHSGYAINTSHALPHKWSLLKESERVVLFRELIVWVAVFTAVLCMRWMWSSGLLQRVPLYAVIKFLEERFAFVFMVILHETTDQIFTAVRVSNLI
jgi:hypothetical protein